jgi:hypothetical protein
VKKSEEKRGKARKSEEIGRNAKKSQRKRKKVTNREHEKRLKTVNLKMFELF